jgi:hypothetical protein
MFDDGPDKTGQRDGLGFSPDVKILEDALVRP